MTRKVLTDAQVVDPRERYAADAEQVDLAAELGISQTTVFGIVVGRSRVAAGGPISPGRARKLTPGDVPAIREAAAGGTPFDELTSRYGVSPQMITNVTSGRAYADLGGPITSSSPSRRAPLTAEQRAEIRRRVRRLAVDGRLLEEDAQRGPRRRAPYPSAFTYGIDLDTLADLSDVDRVVVRRVTGKTYPSAPGPLSRIDRRGQRLPRSPAHEPRGDGADGEVRDLATTAKVPPDQQLEHVPPMKRNEQWVTCLPRRSPRPSAGSRRGS